MSSELPTAQFNKCVLSTVHADSAPQQSGAPPAPAAGASARHEPVHTKQRNRSPGGYPRSMNPWYNVIMSEQAHSFLGGTRAVLQSHTPTLVPSERRVAQACISQPERVASMSVIEVAALAEVSPATVVRACKRMGFRGFQELRELLIRDLGVAAISSPSGAKDHPIQPLFDRAIDGIRGALGSLDVEAFDASAIAIRECDRLLIVGNGASLATAQSAALRFLSSGKACTNPIDIVTQNISAKLLQRGDVCLAVSDSGINRFTLRTAAIAKETGATVVAVTSYGKTELAELADHALVAGADFHSWNNNSVIGNIVQMLLLSALHNAALGQEPSAANARSLARDELRLMATPAQEA